MSGVFTAETGEAGGGGTIRDHAGNLLTAFATPLAAHSGLEADLLAIWEGLWVAKGLGQVVWIESDTTHAISLITKKLLGPANIRHIMVKIPLTIREIKIKISHTPREGNKAAEFLMKTGLESPDFKHMEGQSIPRLLRAIIQLEKNGTPNLRTDSND